MHPPQAPLSTSEAASVSIDVLGELRIRRADAGLRPTGRAARLAAWLALHPGPHPRDRIAAALWPDMPDERARTNLRGALAELRRELGDDDAVIVTRSTAALNSARVRIDLAEFRESAARGEWERALGLHRGPLLADLDDEWTPELRDGVHAEIVDVIRRAIDQLASTDEPRALELIRLGMRLDPLSEALAREHARLSAGVGDRTAALVALQGVAERVRVELGTEPEVETLALLASLRTAASESRWAGVRFTPRMLARREAAVVGRDDEIARVAAAARAGAVVVIEGEAGIGKSTVARAALHRLADASVLAGGCDDDNAIPYAPWVALVEDMLDQLSDEHLHEALRQDGPELARLVPRLRRLVPDAEEPMAAEGGPDAQRWRLFEAVAHMLESAASARPLMLFLDDVQWADAASLALLQHVLRKATRHPIGVIMTLRDLGVSQQVPIHRTLVKLRAEADVDRVRLRGLSRNAVDELVRSAFGERADATLAERLHAETEGHPYFLVELVRSLRNAPSPELGEDQPVPESVSRVIHRRLGGLETPVVETLVMASVVGREFSLGVLERALGREQGAIVDALDSAIDAALVDEVDIASYAFAHAIVRSALYDGISQTRRALLHRRVGDAFVSLREAGVAVHAGVIAYHFRESGALTPDAVLLQHLLAAADEAEMQAAYADAAAYLRDAVRLTQRTDPEGGGSLGLRLAAAVSASGRRKEARELYRQVAETARDHGDARLLGEAAIGFSGAPWRDLRGVDAPAVELLEEARTLLRDDDSPTGAIVAACLAICLYFAPDSEERRLRLVDEALTDARRLADHRAVAMALQARLWMSWTPDGARERIDVAEQVLSSALAVGDVEVELAARRCRAIALLELGDLEEAWAEVSRHGEVAARSGIPYQSMYDHALRTTRSLFEGQLDEARTHAREVAAYADEFGGGDARAFMLVHSIYFSFLEPSDGGVIELLASTVERHPDARPWIGPLAEQLARHGRIDEARACVDRLWPPHETLRFDLTWFAAIVSLAYAVAAIGDRDRARYLYDRLLPYARRVIVIATGAAIIATGSMPLAALATALGDEETARRHLADAEDDIARWHAEGLRAFRLPSGEAPARG